MLCCERQQHPDAIKYLTEAKELYAQATSPGAPELTPLDCGPGHIAADRLERMHTDTLFYLAQAHGHVGDAAKSAVYCHATLQRQLHCRDHDFERFEWCKNAMQLATYYSANQALAVAEHCLLAADHVLVTIPDAERREENGELTEKYLELRANIHLQWAELMRAILRHSRSAKSGGAGQVEAAAAAHVEVPSGITGAATAAPLAIDLKDERLAFTSHLQGLPDPSPECVEVLLVKEDYEVAKRVFKRGLAHIHYAKRYFVMDGFVTDHYAAVNLEAQLYGALILHETDACRALTMHRRRAALLEPIFEGLNPKAYHAVSRQLAFDLGAIHGDILDVRMLGLQGRPPSVVTAKVEKVVERADYFLHKFIDSYKNAEGEAPDRAEAENEEVYIQAYFSLARFWGKVETSAGLTKSLRAYEFIAKYTQKHDVDFMQEELHMAREMVDLLPPKISKLSAAEAHHCD